MAIKGNSGGRMLSTTGYHLPKLAMWDTIRNLGEARRAALLSARPKRARGRLHPDRDRHRHQPACRRDDPVRGDFISSVGATVGAHDRELAAMLADTAIDQARALDATDQQSGACCSPVRTATAVQNEWSSPAPGTTSVLAETAQASDTESNLRDQRRHAAPDVSAVPDRERPHVQRLLLRWYVLGDGEHFERQHVHQRYGPAVDGLRDVPRHSRRHLVGP